MPAGRDKPGRMTQSESGRRVIPAGPFFLPVTKRAEIIEKKFFICAWQNAFISLVSSVDLRHAPIWGSEGAKPLFCILAVHAFHASI
jgi:hypothetical protein